MSIHRIASKFSVLYGIMKLLSCLDDRILALHTMFPSAPTMLFRGNLSYMAISSYTFFRRPYLRIFALSSKLNIIYKMFSRPNLEVFPLRPTISSVSTLLFMMNLRVLTAGPFSSPFTLHCSLIKTLTTLMTSIV